MVSVKRILFATFLAGVGALSACSDIASFGVRVTGDPLSVAITVTGPKAATQYNVYPVQTTQPGQVDTTLPAGDFPATAPGLGPDITAAK